MNSPQSLTKPHPPILIGGGGEKKTLKLVAKYANACNVHGQVPEFAKRKFEILREHCEKLGRDYNEIETHRHPAPRCRRGRFEGRRSRRATRRLAEVGVQAVHGYLVGVDKMVPLEVIGRDVLPQVKDL